jgi:GT2 family glycosyltransferase
MSDPTVSVLIVNWNTRDHLRNCLTSLRVVDEPDDLQVVVVDNASDDGSAAMVRSEFPEVVLVANDRNLGFAAATNQAFELATSDVVLMLNSDTVVSRPSIHRCAAFLRSSPDIGALGCRLLNADGSDQSSCFRFPSLFGLATTALWLANAFPRSRILNWERYGMRSWSRPTSVDVLMGSFLLVRRAALTSDALLDEGYFMYAEETDLCRRLKRDGWRVVFYPDVSITHIHGASSKTPEQLAWSEQAKRQGVLRYLTIWRGVRVAYIANLIMLAGLVPRALIWAARDLGEGARRRSLTWSQVRRAKALQFHAAALFAPEVLSRPWGPPA